MERLLQIQTRLQETVAAMAQLEKELSKSASPDSLTVVGKSLRNQLAQFQAEFLAEASKLETDICTYRLFSFAGERFTINAVSTALQDFQNLFTVVFDAIKGHPKARAIVSPEVRKETEFRWAYTFPGSLGVVLTLPREQEMFDRSPYFDEAIQTVFSMAKSRTANDVLGFARRVGSAAVRQMDKWAIDHTALGFGADIQWKSRQAASSRLFIQLPEIQNLKNAISLSSEATPREVVISGRLVGADADRKSFHFKTEKQDIYGRFTNAITDEHKAAVPADYIATFRVKTRTLYSVEQDEDDYFLLSLAPRYPDETKA